MPLPTQLNELAALRQWVCFKLEWNEARQKYSKPPRSAHTGSLTDATNPQNLATFDEAAAAVTRFNLDGVGFAFTDGWYIGIDLDDCIDDAGSLSAFAAEIVGKVHSYTEKSPSGKGLHILCKYTGGRRISRKNDAIHLEIYNDSRYFTVTGTVYGDPQPLTDCTDVINEICARYLPEQAAAPLPATETANRIIVTDDDDTLWHKMFSSKRGEKIRSLFDGDTSDYNGDESGADLGMCNYLAYWTNGDPVRMDSLFRQTALMRPKWDERRPDYGTYGNMTIAEALKDYTPATYSQQQKDGGCMGWNDIISDDGDGTQAAAADPSVDTQTNLAQQLDELQQLCVFITDNDGTAAALTAAGYLAITCKDTQQIQAFITDLQTVPKETIRKHKFLTLCDNTTEGSTQAAAFQQALKDVLRGGDATGIFYDVPQTAITSAGDLYAANQKDFMRRIRRVTLLAAKPDNTLDYMATELLADIDAFAANNKRKTGFSNVDAWLNGIYSGLYVVAALSSLGKTTFVLQMADQIAAAGDDVIIFSLEQSRLELITKSLARITEQNSPRHGVSSLAIRQGCKTKAVEAALQQYMQSVGDRISIVEGNFSTDIKTLRGYIKSYILNNKTRPVVIVDYLQILAANAKSQNSGNKRDEIDTVITELKRISRDFDLPLFVVSSINRTNYLLPFSMESLKESGCIEYTADVVLGMQFACLDEDLFNKDDKDTKRRRERVKAAKEEDPRKIKLVCEKNRYGKIDGACWFDYYSGNDLFIPSENGGELPFNATISDDGNAYKGGKPKRK